MSPVSPAPEIITEERVEAVSADLPYELQSRIFEQTAAGALAGAGLTVTLVGSLLRDAPPTIWGAVACFAGAAYVAGAGNDALVQALFTRQPVRNRIKSYQLAAGVLMGMAIGVLSYSVFVTSHPGRAAPDTTVPSAPMSTQTPAS